MKKFFRVIGRGLLVLGRGIDRATSFAIKVLTIVLLCAAIYALSQYESLDRYAYLPTGQAVYRVDRQTEGVSIYLPGRGWNYF